MVQTKVVEEIKKSIFYSVTFILFIYFFFRKSCRLWDNVERGRSQMTIRRVRIACCITKATHTLTICNIYCFSTTTMVARTHLKVTFIRTFAVLLYISILSVSPADDLLWSRLAMSWCNWLFNSKNCVHCVQYYAWFQASAAKYLSTSVFSVITRRVVAISYHYSPRNNKEKRVSRVQFCLLL